MRGKKKESKSMKIQSFSAVRASISFPPDIYQRFGLQAPSEKEALPDLKEKSSGGE